jgi:hypothetical protein
MLNRLRMAVRWVGIFEIVSEQLVCCTDRWARPRPQ